MLNIIEVLCAFNIKIYTFAEIHVLKKATLLQNNLFFVATLFVASKTVIERDAL